MGSKEPGTDSRLLGDLREVTHAQTVLSEHTCFSPGAQWNFPALPQGPPQAVGQGLEFEERPRMLAVPRLARDWLLRRPPEAQVVLYLKEPCKRHLCWVASPAQLPSKADDKNRKPHKRLPPM